jgi:peroxiredoxin
MRTIFLSAALMFALFFRSYCQVESPQVHYYIKGHVEGKDGEKIVLHIPSQNPALDETAEIKDGYFVMAGSYRETEKAFLSYDDATFADGEGVMLIPLFLEDTVLLEPYPGIPGAMRIVKGELNRRADSLWQIEITNYWTEVREYSRAADSAYKAGNKEEAMKYYELKRNAEVVAKKRFYEDVLLPDSGSVITLEYLYHYGTDPPVFDIPALKGYLGHIDQDLSSSFYYKSLRNYLNGEESTLQGRKYHDVLVSDSSGNTVFLSSLTNGHKVILLDFWASYCTICRANNKKLRSVYQKYHPDGFEIISISIDDNLTRWKKACDQDRLPWPSFLAIPDTYTDKIYKVRALPTTYLIDQDGKVFKRNAEFDDIVKILSNTFTGNP